MTFFTYTLSSGSLAIDANDFAFFVSIQTDPASGVCNVLGGIPFKGIQTNRTIRVARMSDEWIIIGAVGSY